MNRVAWDNVSGPGLVLRLITPADAEYVYGLRTDPAYNTHLSEVQGTIEDQRRWIEGYKAREADRRELYYVIERRNGVRCGLVRLYGITDDSFTWGSWILDSNKPPKAALESAVLSFGIGFEQLGAGKAYVDVRADNIKALSIYQGLGMTELHRDHQNIYFEYSATKFFADKPRYLSQIMQGQAV